MLTVARVSLSDATSVMETPLCAKFCPTGCLQFLKPEEVSIRLKRSHMEEFLKFQKTATIMLPKEA